MTQNFNRLQIGRISVFLILAVGTFGQSSTKAELVDTFGLLPCDDMNARSWSLVHQISQTPGTKGLIIANPKKDEVDRAKAKFRLILASFQVGEIEDRVSFKISNNDDGSFEFWKIPSGASEPNRDGEKWELPVPDVRKPFIFGYEDEIDECPTFVPRKYAEILLANPRSRAHIVIKAPHDGMSARGFADDTIKTLVEKFGIQRNRIRTFYSPQRKRNSLTYAEYWFVPAKPRHERP